MLQEWFNKNIGKITPEVIEKWFIFNEKETSYRVFAIIVALMVVVTHQKNIGRLLNGKENKAPLFKKNRKPQD